MLFLVVKNPYDRAPQIAFMEAESKEVLMTQLGARPVPLDMLGPSVPEIQVVGVGVGEFATLPQPSRY